MSFAYPEGGINLFFEELLTEDLTTFYVVLLSDY